MAVMAVLVDAYRTCCKRKSKLDTLRGCRERTYGPLNSLRLVNCHHIFYLPCYHICCTSKRTYRCYQKQGCNEHIWSILIGTNFIRHWNIVQLEWESISLSDWTHYHCNLEHGLNEIICTVLDNILH